MYGETSSWGLTLLAFLRLVIIFREIDKPRSDSAICLKRPGTEFFSCSDRMVIPSRLLGPPPQESSSPLKSFTTLTGDRFFTPFFSLKENLFSVLFEETILESLSYLSKPPTIFFKVVEVFACLGPPSPLLKT